MSEEVSKEFLMPPASELDAAKPVDAGKQSVTVASGRPRRIRARLVQIVSVVVLVVLLVLLWRFLGNQAATTKTPGAGAGRGEVVPVEMANVTQQDVPIQIKAIGNVEALSTIAVRSQVEGTLLRVGFAPGQEVKKAICFSRSIRVRYRQR